MPPAGFVVQRNATSHAGLSLPDADADDDGVDTTADGLSPLRVNRRALVAVLKRRGQRARRFRTLPLSALFFCIYIAAMVTRVGVVSDSFTLEKNVLVNVISTDPNVGTYAPSSLAAWWAFIAAPDTGILTSLFASPDASLSGAGFVLGGAVLTQRRWRSGPCPGVGTGNNVSTGVPLLYSSFLPLANASSAEPGPCFTTGGSSTAAFGLATHDGISSDAYDYSYLTPAFQASTVPSDTQPEPRAFRWFLSAYDPIVNTSASMADLLTAQWYDKATASLDFSFVIISPELGRIGHVSLRIDATAGGLATPTWLVRTFPLDPYATTGPIGRVPSPLGSAPLPNLSTTLDVFVVMYLVYLYLSAIHRTARACLGAMAVARRQARAEGKGGKGLWCCAASVRDIDGSLPPTCCGELYTRLVSSGFILDWGCVAALTAAVATWALHARGLSTLRASLVTLPSLTPSVDDFGVVTPGPGSVGPIPLWATTEALVRSSLTLYSAWKDAAVWALLFLSMRLFKTFSFHARLGVLGATLAKSLSDIINMGGLLAIPFAMYGVWGHFSFGAQVVGWSDPTTSVTTFFRFIMYDYDFAGMFGADPTPMTNFFYCSFMLLVTNLLLWLFLAVLFDAYSAERMRAQNWPSFYSETRAFIAAIPHMLPSTIVKWVFPSGSGSGGGVLSSGRSIVTWEEVIDATTTGALRHVHTITPLELVHVLGMTPEAAGILIADVSAAARARVTAKNDDGSLSVDAAAQYEAAAGYYGFGFPGGPRLPPNVLSRLQRIYPALARTHDEAQAARDAAVLAGASSVQGVIATTGAGVMGGGARPPLRRGDEDNDDDDEDEDEEDEHDKAYPPVFRSILRAMTSSRARSASSPSSFQSRNASPLKGGAGNFAQSWRPKSPSTHGSSPRGTSSGSGDATVSVNPLATALAASSSGRSSLQRASSIGGMLSGGGSSSRRAPGRGGTPLSSSPSAHFGSPPLDYEIDDADGGIAADDSDAAALEVAGDAEAVGSAADIALARSRRLFLTSAATSASRRYAAVVHGAAAAATSSRRLV